MTVHRLIYISSGRKKFSPDELEDILHLSRRTNAAEDVTGLLLYLDGNFLQLLEGENEVVENLYERIEDDPRHHGVIVLVREDAEDRQFPDWAMGFKELDPETHASYLGAFQLTEEILADKLPPGTGALAKSLIDSFVMVNVRS